MLLVIFNVSYYFQKPLLHANAYIKQIVGKLLELCDFMHPVPNLTQLTNLFLIYMLT